MHSNTGEDAIGWGTMTTGRPSVVHINCLHCKALYRLIKAEAGPETNNSEVSCRICGGPLPGRDESFVLKYFLIRDAAPFDS